jgi:hypothetical protein
MTTSFCSKVCIIGLGLALWSAPCAWADPAAMADAAATADAIAKADAKACATTTTGKDIRSVVESLRLNSVPVYVDWGPWGGTMSAAIRPPPPEPGDATKAAIDYRIVVEATPPDLLPSEQISAKKIPDAPRKGTFC